MSFNLGKFEKKQPETVEFCNKTKCGFDVADQMGRQYSIKAGTRRWHVAVSTAFLASIHLCSIKNEQMTRFQDEISCSSLLQSYLKTTSLKN